MQIKNQVILITGAAVRVGRAVALSLAEQGAHVAFTYLNDEEPWPKTKAEIEAFGVDCLALPLDLRQPDLPRQVVQQVIKQFGRVNILINNASVWLSAPFLDITLDTWNTALTINLTGPFLCSQAVVPYMLKQQSGLIINITDLSAYQTWPTYAHHAASKAGLVALTRVMAAELAPHIRVNAIAPGTVLLPENAGEAKIKWAIENSLLKQVGQPEDVARTAKFLIESDFATGAVYFIDGGRALV